VTSWKIANCIIATLSLTYKIPKIGFILRENHEKVEGKRGLDKKVFVPQTTLHAYSGTTFDFRIVFRFFFPGLR